MTQSQNGTILTSSHATEKLQEKNVSISEQKLTSYCNKPLYYI